MFSAPTKATLTAELHCRAGCGFYGNPHWNGLCSKCWREHCSQQRQKQPRRQKFEKQGAETHSNSHRISSSQSQLNKPDGKNKRRSGPAESTPKKSATFSSMLKTNESSYTKLDSLVFDIDEKLMTPEAAEARKSVVDWLEKNSADRMKIETVVRGLHSFSQLVMRCQQGMIDLESVGEQAQDLYVVLDDCCGKKCTVLVEHYICTRWYDILFSSQDDEDEKRDVKLQNRIRSLNWVALGVLDSGIDTTNSEAREHLAQAVEKIVGAMLLHSPGEKLQSIVDCCLAVMSALRSSQVDLAPSADDTLPALICLLIRANPPFLQSNVNFISRFASPNRLMVGEQAYYFTTLCCALKYIDELSPRTLNMSPEDFENYMLGKLVPPMSAREALFEPIEKVITVNKEIEDLTARTDRLLSTVTSTSDQMNQELQQLWSLVSDMRERYPLLDDEEPALDESISGEAAALTLPAPLVPTPVHQSTRKPRVTDV